MNRSMHYLNIFTVTFLNEIEKKDLITTLEKSSVPIEADDEFIYFEFPTHMLIM